jgi:TRAP-type C4-dicarboxylate transport system substrate-binding protein
MFKSLGAVPIPLPFADLHAALQAGRVDGQENPLNTILAARFYEVQKYLSLTRHVYSPWIVTAGKTWWAALSDEERGAVQASAQVARESQRKDSRESSARALEALRQRGMQVTVINEVELARMREKIRPLTEKSAFAGELTRLRQTLVRG